MCPEPGEGQSAEPQQADAPTHRERARRAAEAAVLYDVSTAKRTADELSQPASNCSTSIADPSAVRATARAEQQRLACGRDALPKGESVMWRRFVVTAIAAVTCLSGLTGCRSSEQRLYDDAVPRLVATVGAIRHNMSLHLKRAASDARRAALTTMRTGMPAENTVTIFSASSDGPGPVEIKAAVRQQIDGHGPGSTTELMQVCVAYTLTSIKSSDVSLRDTACSAELPPVKFTIRLADSSPGDPQATPRSITTPSATQPPGDAAPHNADNNRWKQRIKLSADDRRAGNALAARIRPQLAALQAAGDVTPDATHSALLELGLESERVTTKAMHTPVTADTPPPSALFAVKFGAGGCVIGDVGPGQLHIEVTGAAAEFGCLEPYTP